jgi:26S proteasome regulatory subunit N2
MHVRAQVTQHGACLGLGLAGLGSNDEEALEEVKGVLYTDSAVAGEAAGIAIGLLAVGSASGRAQELLTYAHDTQHEKARGALYCLSFRIAAKLRHVLSAQ